MTTTTTTTTAKRRTDPERAQHRRNQVLQAAAVCFARSGFHGASMSEISKEAGMSAGHIYNYFDSKDAIIKAFVDLEMERVTTKLRLLETRDDPLQAMVDDAPIHVEESLNPQFFQLPMEMFAEASRNPAVADAMRSIDMAARKVFRPLIKRERELRGLAVDDLLLDGRIDTLISLFHGLPIRALFRPELQREGLIEGYRVVLKALLMT